jgi:CBS domain-containing protein
MKCSDIMDKNVEWLTEKDSIRKAATVMAEAGVGFLPICDAEKRVIGVVTDRDLTTRALAKKIDPDTTSAALVVLLLDEELVRGRAQTAPLTGPAGPAAHDYARSRAVFTAKLADGEAKLLEQVADGVKEMGLASFELSEIERRYPEPGARLILKLQTLTRTSSAVRRQDALNLELTTRARDRVTGRQRALTGPPTAYTRRGAIQELSAFSAAARVV